LDHRADEIWETDSKSGRSIQTAFRVNHWLLGKSKQEKKTTKPISQRAPSPISHQDGRLSAASVCLASIGSVGRLSSAARERDASLERLALTSCAH
jgi:hypothetical protein